MVKRGTAATFNEPAASYFDQGGTYNLAKSGQGKKAAAQMMDLYVGGQIPHRVHRGRLGGERLGRFPVPEIEAELGKAAPFGR